MNVMKKWLGLVGCLLLTAVAMVPPATAEEEEPAMVVGRIYHIEGDLLRYVPEEKDWVAVTGDAPFGTEDTLHSGSRGMAELIVPNGTWIRIGNSTQIQFITLDPDLAEMDLAAGVARFYNKSSEAVIKVTSPFGYVLSDPGTVFDFHVGENSAEVVAVLGKVSFVPSATEAKYDVATGSPSILADGRQVSAGEGTVDPGWDRWNTGRENFWVAKARAGGRSVEYLPPSLRAEAYALEDNGGWELVAYEGTERWFWRPRVAVGWAPFTVGRWTVWYGDQTWIPAEPFGYVTHHYGNWIYARNYWYWAPPVVSVRIGGPRHHTGFYWYPGRVSWIHTRTHVGWVPLAPNETYYSYRRWGGPHAVVVNNINITRININVRSFAYTNHAVVINRNNLYNVNDYRKVRVAGINHATIVNNYRTAPVVNNTVINKYTTIKQRYNYTNVKVNEKPRNTVTNRIQRNATIIREGRPEKAAGVREQVKSMPAGRIAGAARIETPRVTNRIGPASEDNRPKSATRIRQGEIKGRGKPDQPEKPGKHERPAAARERGGPKKTVAKPAEKANRPEQPVAATNDDQSQPKTGPAKPGKPGKPLTKTTEKKPRPIIPTKKGMEQPAAQSPAGDLEKSPDRSQPKPLEKDTANRLDRHPSAEGKKIRGHYWGEQ